MTIEWDSGASLLDTGQRFPVHGTIEHCVEAWRASGDRQDSAVLLTELGITVPPSSVPAFSFRGKALEDLSAALADERRGARTISVER